MKDHRDTVLVTGGAGFIGSHVVERFLCEGSKVIVLDSFDPFYSPAEKRKNLTAISEAHPGLVALEECDLRNVEAVDRIVGSEPISTVVHCAALAGVRPSIERPQAYEEVNVTGTMNLLNACKRAGVKDLLLASSSSVYGGNPKVPFCESDDTSFPISPYAATKKAMEVMAHAFHRLFGLNMALLRFFTVYGPRQRPDLAIRKFSEWTLASRAVPKFGDGSSGRDYTFISDIVDGVFLAKDWLKKQKIPAYEIFNLGHSSPVTLNELIAALEEVLGRKIEIEPYPMQPGDMELTYADLGKSSRILGYSPKVSLIAGLKNFFDWFRSQRS